MPNPGSTITITLEAFTEKANAKLQAFFKVNSDLIASENVRQIAGMLTTATAAEAGMKKISDAAQQTGLKIAGLSYYFRSVIDGIRLAAAGGGPRAAFFAIDEALRGVIASGALAGAGFATLGAGALALIPIIASAAAAWSAYKAKVAEAASVDRVQQQQLDMQAMGFAALKTALDNGLISVNDWQKIHGELMAGTEGSIAQAMRNMQALGISDKQIENFQKLQKLEREMSDNTLDDFGRERAKAQENYEDRLKQIADLASKSKMATDERVAAESKASAEVNARMAEIEKAEQTKQFQDAVAQYRNAQNTLITSAQEGAERRSSYSEQEFEKEVAFLHDLGVKFPQAREEAEKEINAAIDKRNAAIREEFTETQRLGEELKHLAEIKEQIAKKDFDFQRRGIEQNPFLTNEQRRNQLLALNSQQQTDVNSLLGTNSTALSKATDPQQQIKLLEERKELQGQLNELLLEQQKLMDQTGLINNVQAAWVSFFNKVSETAKDLANVLVSPFEGMRQGMDKAMNEILLKGGNVKTFFGNVAVGILVSMRQAFSQMVADWATKTLMMLIQWALTHTAMTAIFAAQKQAQVAIHTESESEMTIITLAMSLIRRIAAFLEAQPYIFLAAVKAASAVADIPYVGPILAPIAAATTFAALEAMAVFKEGGFTGSGGSDEVAGLVHRGEFVIPAERVNQMGLGFFQAIHSGRFSLASANVLSSSHSMEFGGREGSAAPIHNHTHINMAVFDTMEAGRAWAESNEGPTWFMSMLTKNIHKFQG